VEKQVAMIWIATNGHLDDVPVKAIKRFEKELFEFLDINASDLLRQIRETGQFPKEVEEALKAQVTTFKETFAASLQSGVGA